MGTVDLPKGGKKARPKTPAGKAVKNTATEVTAMLENTGYQFNTGEIEKSLSGKQWGIDDLEAHTNNMLRQKAGIGPVVDSQKANLVSACVFKDNAKKPKTVTDLKLSVNIPETELIDSDNDRMEINQDEHLQNIDRNDELEAVRNSGFSAASNLIVSILNEVNLECECLENLKEKHEILLREYEDDDVAVLPDEHYQIRLRYFSKARLSEEREAYDKRIRILGGETQRLWDLLEVIYQDSKSVFKVNDFEDLVRKNKNRMSPYDPQKPIEASFAAARGEKEKIRVLLAKMEERIKNISDSMYPVERQISEERLTILKDEFSSVENEIDPYNVQPGILVDIELTTIKRKRTTLDSMSLALGRFLDSVSGCFRGA